MALVTPFVVVLAQSPFASTASATTPPSAYELAVLGSSPLLYYRLGDAAGSPTVTDIGSLGSAANGTVTGAATLGAPGLIPNDPDTALSLDGSSGSVSIPAPGTSIPPITAFSIEGWFKTTRGWSGTGYVASIAGLPAGFGVSDGSVFGSVLGTDSTVHKVSAGSGLNDGTAHYLVFTDDGTNFTLYLDGNAVASAAAVGVAYNGAQGGALGSNGTSGFFSGTIDEIAAYDYALNASTIDDHYVAPGGTGGMIAYPVQAIVGKQFNGVVGAITVQANSSGTPTPSSAHIAWSDGTSSIGKIVAGPTQAGQSVFYVRATNTFSSPIDPGSFTVTAYVGSSLVTGKASLIVLPLKPNAYFIVNPELGTQNQVSLLMPAAPGPGQQPILGYEWTSTADTDHPIYDTPQTRPFYACIINGLIASGGSDGSAYCNGQNIPSFIQGAIQLGILPTTTYNFIGGLTSPDIFTIAQLWEQYYPQHIIPYVFPYFSETQTSNVAFSLAIGLPGDNTLPGCLGVDSAQCWTVPNVAVEPDCALVTAVLGISSTCDLSAFKPRSPDFVVVNLTGQLAFVLAVQGGVSLVVSHTFLDSASSDSIFLQFSVGAGLGFGGGSAISATLGWVNGPFSSTPSDSKINDFVDHCTVSGGGGLGIEIGPISLGGGALGIVSPGGDPGYTTGFETSFTKGGAGGSAIAGVSENYALSLAELGVPLSNSQLNVLKDIFNGVSGGSISSTMLTNDATTIVNSLPGLPSLVNHIIEVLAAAQALKTGCGLLNS
jgi:hypothetical protein